MTQPEQTPDPPCICRGVANGRPYRTSLGEALAEVDALRAENERLRDDFVNAVLDTEVSWEVANLNLTVRDVRDIARWLAPTAAALAARSDADREPDPSPEPHQETDDA